MYTFIFMIYVCVYTQFVTYNFIIKYHIFNHNYLEVLILRYDFYIFIKLFF